MKKRMHLLSLMVAATLMFTSCGKKAETDSKDLAEDQNEEKFKDTDEKKDTEFAVGATDDGLLEVQLGKLAVANATMQQTRELGQMMIDDHGKCNGELKSLADGKNITLPETLSDKNQKTYDEFVKKSGAEFDKDYTKLMISAHKSAIDAFKHETEKGNDTDLKSWAAEKVPALEHHLAMAENAHKAAKELKK